jgi:hypothetical protein
MEVKFKQHLIASALMLLASAATTGTAQAALISRAGGMVYDNVNNITWAADANLFIIQALLNANLVNDIIAGNGGVIHETPFNSTYNSNGTHYLTSADFNADLTSPSLGAMTWWGAQAWANNLTLGGVKGWSLPTTDPAVFGYQTNSQMSDLFYNQLGGVRNYKGMFPTDNPNYNLFHFRNDSSYWSGTEYAPDPSQAWVFNTTPGNQQGAGKVAQLYALAVHPGDVSAAPVPAAFWLLGSGLMGLLGLMRRGKCHVFN